MLCRPQSSFPTIANAKQSRATAPPMNCCGCRTARTYQSLRRRESVQAFASSKTGANWLLKNCLGKRDRELLERPEDWKMTEGIKEEVLRTGVSYQGEVTVSLNGRPCHYHIRIDPQRDGYGHIVGITGATFDLTESKQAQAEREK